MRRWRPSGSLRNVKAQGAIQGVRAIDAVDSPKDAGIVELLDAAITETGVAGIGAVALGLLPFGTLSAIGRVDRVTSGVVVQAGEVKTAQVAIGSEDVPWLFFIRIVADRIADVGYETVGKISRCVALNVIRT